MPSLRSIQLYQKEEQERAARRLEEAKRFAEESERQRLGLPALEKENARLAAAVAEKEWAEQAKQIRRSLVMEPSPDWNAPKYQPIADETSQQITTRCVAAWRSFIASDSGLSADLTEDYLKLFLQQNVDADLTNPETFRSAVAYIRQRLTRPTPTPEPMPEPTRARDAAGRFVSAAGVEDTPESHNPYPEGDVRRNRWWNSDEYRELCRRDEFQGRQRELSVLFRGTVEEICNAAGMEFSSENMHALMKMWERSRLPWDRPSLRRVFLKRWGAECPESVFESETEKAVWQIDTMPEMSAADFAAAVGSPHPEFRNTGLVPTRNVGVR